MYGQSDCEIERRRMGGNSVGEKRERQADGWMDTQADLKKTKKTKEKGRRLLKLILKRDE